MTKPEPMFRVGDKVVDIETDRVGHIVGVEYNEDIEEYLYEPDFCDEYEIYLDVALAAF
jgi:hypothetical protein